MDDQNDFEGASVDQSSETPDDGGIEGINPWREPISLITWGFILTTFTFNFLFLQYLLPTIGVALLLIGFRRLRNGNHWFFKAWIIIIIKLIWQSAQLVIYATPLVTLYNNNVSLLSVGVVLQVVLLFVYRKAVWMVLRQAQITPSRDPVLSAIIWIGLIAVCAFTPFRNSWLAIIPLFISYILIMRSMYRLGDDLSEASDEYVPAPVKVSGSVIAWGYLLCCFILVSIASIAANHIKLDASERAAVTNSATRAELTALGFPENILVDISDVDIARLSGVIYVTLSSDSLEFEDTSTLKATTVYVELPNNLMYMFVYFDWRDKKAYWQDGFSIWGEKDFELLNGVLLYKKNKTEYTAPIPRLKCENVTTYSFFGSNESRQISGAVSYPFLSKNQRGYVFYRVQLPKDQWGGCNCMNYVHYALPFQYPYVETEKRIFNGTYFVNNRMRQHYSNFEMQAFRDANH